MTLNNEQIKIFEDLRKKIAEAYVEEKCFNIHIINEHMRISISVKLDMLEIDNNCIEIGGDNFDIDISDKFIKGISYNESDDNYVISLDKFDIYFDFIF